MKKEKEGGGGPNSRLSIGLLTSWNKFLQFYNKLFCFGKRDVFIKDLFRMFDDINLSIKREGGEKDLTF